MAAFNRSPRQRTGALASRAAQHGHSALAVQEGAEPGEIRRRERDDRPGRKQAACVLETGRVVDREQKRRCGDRSDARAIIRRLRVGSVRIIRRRSQSIATTGDAACRRTSASLATKPLITGCPSATPRHA
jgi:hypothetical protein